jgi:hypothetical protein
LAGSSTIQQREQGRAGAGEEGGGSRTRQGSIREGNTSIARRFAWKLDVLLHVSTTSLNDADRPYTMYCTSGRGAMYSTSSQVPRSGLTRRPLEASCFVSLLLLLLLPLHFPYYSPPLSYSLSFTARMGLKRIIASSFPSLCFVYLMSHELDTLLAFEQPSPERSSPTSPGSTSTSLRFAHQVGKLTFSFSALPFLPRCQHRRYRTF